MRHIWARMRSPYHGVYSSLLFLSVFRLSKNQTKQLRVRDFTKLVNSPVFGISAAEEAARADSADSTDGTDDDQRGGTAPRRGQGGLTLRDYQLEVNMYMYVYM